MRSTKLLLCASLLLIVAGCHGNSGGPNGPTAPYQPVSYTPMTNTPPPTTIVPLFTQLTVEVTNDTSVMIDVTASTPDEDLDFGEVAPGETISTTLDELPSYVVLYATATTPDAYGIYPYLPSTTIQLGFDYTADTGFAGVQWTDRAGTSGVYNDVLRTGSPRTVAPKVVRRK